MSKPKKKWTVCLAVFVEKYVTVEAHTALEAKASAAQLDENNFSLCCHCSQNFALSDISGDAISAECESDD